MSPTSKLFPTTQGFMQISRSRSETMSDQEGIPLQKVVSIQSTGARRVSTSRPAMPDSTDSEKYQYRKGGLRKKSGVVGGSSEQEEGALTTMGRIYSKILNFSVVTRYFLYVLPLGAAIAVPIVVGATAAQNATIGGVRIVWLFTWVEIIWLSLWVTKLFAHFLPYIFKTLAGVVSSKIRKYSLLIRALELPLSFVGWALVSLLTFTPLMLHNPTQRALAESDPTQKNLKGWQSTLRQILGATLVCTLIFFGQRLLIQLIAVNYHDKQFESKIKADKRQVALLSLLYESSRKQFPEYCDTFAEEDAIINDALNLSKFGNKSGKGSGSATPLRLLQNVGRLGDNVTTVMGNFAQELTGKKVLFNGNTANAIVSEALEKPKACEALAKRIWISFVMEGNEALYIADLIDVLGEQHHDEAEETFTYLDRDGNGDVSLNEMIGMVTELGRSRKSIGKSMHDVDQAIKALSGLLAIAVLVISVLVFVAFLNKNFTTTLATTGTAILSFSFVFAATCQEVLGSCIFLFVKHPYDIGDRVDLNTDQLTVEHISLLYTCFKRVNTGKTVQIPNIVLNNLWVENITRSKAMREQISLFCNFDTPMEDIIALKDEMVNFVTNSDNNRDFQPDIDIEVIGLAEMNKMELRIECKHKSNWANETIRASRRSRFMCALVLAIRKVPIYGPGGGGAALGSIDQPTFSVAVSPEDAAKLRNDFADAKEAKRLIPTKKPDVDVHSTADTDYSGVTAHQELRAMQALNSRNPAFDPARDETLTTTRNNSSEISTEDRVNDTRNVEEIRGMLHRESTRGRRQPNQSLSPVIEPLYQQTYPVVPPTGQYVPPPGASGAPQIPPVPGNAFNQNIQRRDVGSTSNGSQTNAGSSTGPPPSWRK